MRKNLKYFIVGLIALLFLLKDRIFAKQKIDLSQIDTNGANISDLGAQGIADYIHNELKSSFWIEDDNVINALKGLNESALKLVYKKFGYRDLSERHLGILEPFYAENNADLYAWILDINNEAFTNKFKQIYSWL